jgi:hypothetical protein
LTSEQAHAAVALYPDGASVVVWDSRRQEHGTYGVFLQRFSASGRPIGDETHVNLYTMSMQLRPAVAVDGPGGTWVAWESFGQDGSMSGIIARRFGSRFGKGTDEILVNQSVAGQQSEVVVAADSRGNATFFWTAVAGAERSTRVVGRRFDRYGRPLGDEFPVGGSVASRATLPSAAIDSHDRIIVVWAETDEEGRPTGIRGRIFSDRGGALTPELPISGDDTGAHIEPSVSAAPDGRFVVAWLTATHEDYAVSVRSFDALGRPLGPAHQDCAVGCRHVSGVSVAAAEDGRYAVCWNALGKDHRHTDITACLHDADGRRLRGPIGVNRRLTGRQRLAIASGKQRSVWGRDGRLAIAWSGDSGMGDATAANLTMLVPPGIAYDLSSPPPATYDPVSSASPDALAARPYEPPTYDPATIPSDPLGGDPNPVAPRGGEFGFLAIVNTGWTPPDPHLAVGPDHLVAMTNGAIAFFQKNGTQDFEDEIEGSFGFWGSLGADNFVFDPEVIFDPHSNRFMAMANERSDDNRSFFLLAVSDDADPNGNWFKYRLDVTALAGNDIDSPNIAVDNQAVYLTADFFGPDKYLIYILDKADVLVGNIPTTRSLLLTGEQSIGIPVTYDATAPALYMIGAFEFGTYDSLRLHAITDPLGTPQRTTMDISVPTYSHPEDPPQMGTSSRPELFEARFWSCMVREGSLWAVHHQDGSRVRARWYEFRMNQWPVGGTPELVQWGEIDPGGSVRTFFPSIWVNEAGSAAITCARSSPTEFISMSRAVRLAGDAPGTFGPLEFVKQSTAPYTPQRWGDYSGTASDPARPASFWGHHEYSPGGSSWNTWIAEYVVDQSFLDFAYPDGKPDFIDPAGGTRMRVEVSGAGGAVPQPGTGLLHHDAGAGWQTAPMDVVSDNVYDAVFPAADCPDDVLYYVSAETVDGVVFTDPRNAPDDHYATIAAHGRVVFFEDDFESDQGWTVSGDATDGHWERGIPAGGGDRGDPPTDHDGSGRCTVTDNADGNSDVDDGYTFLTSPTMDLSEGDAEVHYALWYTNYFGNDPNNDLFKTYVSDDNGENWVLVETTGPQTSSGWTEHAFVVGDFVTPNDQVKVMFEASDLGGASIVEAGIDAIVVMTYACEAPCPGDPDGDMDGSGTTDGLDIQPFIDAMLGTPSPDDLCHGDFDGGGALDTDDIPAMVAALLAG